MYYVLSINGWEEYAPTWFFSVKSSREFSKAVRLSIDKSIRFLKQEESDSFWDGHALNRYLVPLMQEAGFLLITADFEVDIGGSCLYEGAYYGKYTHRPKIFTKQAWNIIVAHNTEIRHKFFSNDTKPLKKKSKKIIKHTTKRHESDKLLGGKQQTT